MSSGAHGPPMIMVTAVPGQPQREVAGPTAPSVPQDRPLVRDTGTVWARAATAPTADLMEPSWEAVAGGFPECEGWWEKGRGEGWGDGEEEREEGERERRKHSVPQQRL